MITDPKTRPDPLLGKIVGERYHLTERIGAGAYAEVYRARHLSIGSLEAAVKVLKPGQRERDEVLQRFKQETWVAGAVRSPFVAQIYDADVTDDGLAWLAMEFVNGPTLHRVMKRFGPIPHDIAAVWIAGILRGLVAIHSQGIVHRDLKPGNVLMSWPPSERIPQPRVVDFGIAKVVDAVGRAGEDLADPTHTGGIVCTPRYAAPEQLLKQPVPASDIYALGIIGLYMVAGVAPYGDTDAAVLMANHLAPEPVPIHPLVEDSPLRDVLARATDKRTTHRYRSALEMLDELEPVVRKLSATTPDRDDIARLEELFPKDERVHWKLRRQDAMRETMPSRSRSPLYAIPEGNVTGALGAPDPTEDRFPSGEVSALSGEREPGAPGRPTTGEVTDSQALVIRSTSGSARNRLVLALASACALAGLLALAAIFGAGADTPPDEPGGEPTPAALAEPAAILMTGGDGSGDDPELHAEADTPEPIAVSPAEVTEEEDGSGDEVRVVEAQPDPVEEGEPTDAEPAVNTTTTQVPSRSVTRPEPQQQPTQAQPEPQQQPGQEQEQEQSEQQPEPRQPEEQAQPEPEPAPAQAQEQAQPEPQPEPTQEQEQAQPAGVFRSSNPFGGSE